MVAGAGRGRFGERKSAFVCIIFAAPRRQCGAFRALGRHDFRLAAHTLVAASQLLGL